MHYAARLGAGVNEMFSNPTNLLLHFRELQSALSKSSQVYTPTIHKKRRRALRALFSLKSLLWAIFLRTKPKRHPRVVVRPLRSRCNQCLSRQRTLPESGPR